MDRHLYFYGDYFRDISLYILMGTLNGEKGQILLTSNIEWQLTSCIGTAKCKLVFNLCFILKIKVVWK